MSGLYFGANLPRTSYGYDLPDGGFCALRDGQIEFAIAEERLTGKKKAGGYEASLAFYLQKFGRARLDEMDSFAVSTCCDVVGRTKLSAPNINPDRLIYCPHHLSHALGSFSWSGFDEALVIVMDSGGDTLEEVHNKKWWLSRREQQSAFLITQTSYNLVEQNAVEPGSIGFGELFRAVTYFLGWRGARFAGNTMALASLGDPNRLGLADFFQKIAGNYYFPKGNNPNEPLQNRSRPSCNFRCHSGQSSDWQ